MKVSTHGIELIKKDEAFRSKPYMDPVGIPTIGYGTTMYPDGTKVKMTDAPITEHVAIQYLSCHINNIVIPTIKAKVRVDLEQNQIDALASFIYNVGSGNFGKSQLLRLINVYGKPYDVEQQFLRWNKGTINGKKVVLNGLVKRRQSEADLFNKHHKLT